LLREVRNDSIDRSFNHDPSLRHQSFFGSPSLSSRVLAPPTCFSIYQQFKSLVSIQSVAYQARRISSELGISSLALLLCAEHPFCSPLTRQLTSSGTHLHYLVLDPLSMIKTRSLHFSKTPPHETGTKGRSTLCAHVRRPHTLQNSLVVSLSAVSEVKNP